MTLATSWAALAGEAAPISQEEKVPEEKAPIEPAIDEKEESDLLPCLIADSAAFLRNVPLGDVAHKIFTIRDVVSEIRDPQTRQRLAVLPYEVIYREPSLESIKFVTEFSKQTGDFKNLSAVDLRVLALTHQLESEYCDRAHIRAQPEKKTEVVSHSKMPSNVKMVGFYSTKKNKNSAQTPDYQTQPGSEGNEEEMSTDNATENDEKSEDMELDDAGANKNNEHPADTEQDIEKEDCIENCNVIDDAVDDAVDDVIDDAVDDAVDEDDDDEEGWITPKNIKQLKKEMGEDESEEQIDLQTVKCACLTTDFAMQNVLIQMGLHIVSVDGRLIRQARSYIQKCFGCHRETHDMTKVFCPMCGNKTLRRIAVSIAKDGTMQYHYPRRKKNPNTRGTKFSLPHPKGGRHGDDVILCEDQKLKLRNMPKAKDPVNAMDPDFVGRASPFSANDTNSRAFTLGLHMRQARPANPNANRKKRTGKRR